MATRRRTKVQAVEHNSELELIKWARELAENRKISFERILEAIEEGLAISVRRKYEGDRAFRIKLDPETGAPTIYRLWKVVEDVNVATREISLEAALYENPNLKVGDYIEDIDEDEKIELDRIGYNTFRQIMTSKVRSLENEKVIKSYEPFLGQIVTGRVRMSKAGSMTLIFPELNAASSDEYYDETETLYVEGVIKRDGMIRGEKFRANTPVRALLQALESGDPNKQQMVLSRSAPDFLAHLLAEQVPELRSGEVELIDIEREPGVRAKVVVTPGEYGHNIDPIGALIGINSSRIKPITRELSGEKIDVILYSDDITDYTLNLLTISPEDREQTQVLIDEQSQEIKVAVPEEKLSSVIGQRGINVRLTSKIVGWKIIVSSIEQFETAQKEEDDKLVAYFMEKMQLDAETALYLVEQGYKHIEEIALAECEELYEMFDEEDADSLQALAKQSLAEELDKQQEAIAAANVDPRLADLDGMTDEILLQLIDNNIKTLEDLADLANDELSSYIGMGEEVANSLIMQARQIVWFEAEETAA